MSSPIHRSRRGHAMLIVMIVIITSSIFGVVQQRQLMASLRVESARLRSEAYVYGPLTVLSVAVDLLEKVKPSGSVDYKYSHTYDGITTLYRISYVKSGAQWNVTADPDPTANTLPDLPTAP